MLNKATKDTPAMAIKYHAGAIGLWVSWINHVANKGAVPPSKALAQLKVKAKPE